jgi:hypothetical protein
MVVQGAHGSPEGGGGGGGVGPGVDPGGSQLPVLGSQTQVGPGCIVGHAPVGGGAGGGVVTQDGELPGGSQPP